MDGGDVITGKFGSALNFKKVDQAHLVRVHDAGDDLPANKHTQENERGIRPPAEICAVRSLMRHRESLMRTACQHLLRVQKALDQMNVQLHHAVTDITGYTGLAILEAIVAGERNPEALARLRDYRCKKSEAEIARALRGDWREEHIFTLRQSLEAWRFHQNLMTDCDEQIASRMDALEDREAPPIPMTGKKSNKPHEEPMRR